MTDDEIIAVVQARKEGQKIQSRLGGDVWEDNDNPLWNFGICEYRVKQEPLECWANVYPDATTTYWTHRELAVKCAAKNAIRTAVHMREVEK